MIDVLLSAEIDGEPLPLGDVVGNAMLLVQAGLETTASAMSFAFHYLATQPAERDRLAGDPELLPRAVEEFIRFAGSIHGIPRTVRHEVELSGQTFCPGESVQVNYASANRDPARFPDADRCVLDRRENRHLGFGAGGRAMAQLISELFLRAFANDWLARGDDGAVLPAPAAGERLVMATDAHVVSPLFFPGGDIGSLSVHGTVNDLAVMGAFRVGGEAAAAVFWFYRFVTAP